MTSQVKWLEDSNTFIRITKIAENHLLVEDTSQEEYLEERGF